MSRIPTEVRYGREVELNAERVKTRRGGRHCLPDPLWATGTKLQLRGERGHAVVDSHHTAALFVDGDQERRREAGFAPEPLQLRRQAKKTGSVGEVVAEDQHRADLFVEDEVTQPIRDV